MVRSLALWVLCASLFTNNSAAAKEKERQWQTGKVLDANREKTNAGTVNSSAVSATSSGSNTSGSVSGTSTAVYRVSTYVIEAGDYIYQCQEHLKWKWSKPAQLTVNAPVQFAIEKDRLYIKSEDGSEHETKIIKMTLKPKQPSGQ